MADRRDIAAGGYPQSLACHTLDRMDARLYQRYLDYAERYSYFRRPGMTKLTFESWRPLDAELGALTAKAEKTETERSRERELRLAILRD